MSLFSGFIRKVSSKRGHVYFNQRFGVSAIAMQKLGVFNAKIGVDNKMFVDPKLLNLGRDEFDGAHEELTNGQTH